MPMSLRTRRGLALLASLMLLAAACTPGATQSPVGTPAATPATTPSETSPGTSPGESPTGAETDFEDLLFNFTYEPEPGTEGGRVVISDWQAANQLNPYYSNAFANTQVFAATMRGLGVVTADGHWKADLAAELPKFSNDMVREDDTESTCPATEEEPNPEPTTGFEVDLQIKPGLLWSDGEPLDLEDLRYTWEWVLDEEQTGIVTLGWDLIDGIEVGDDGLTATVHFCKNYAGYLGVLLQSALLPEHYMSEIPIAEANANSYPLSADIANAPVSGPFKYVTAGANSIELERNENWKGGDHPPYLDGVTYQFFPDNKEGMIAAFLAGEIDVATNLLQGDYDAIKGVDPDVGVALVEPAWEYEHLDLNQSGAGPGRGHPALTDIEVRKAIAQAIDKSALYETVFPGQPVPDINVCTNAPPGTYWRLEDGIECLDFDVEAANQTLEDAGYTDSDGDGIRENEGEPLVLEHCTSNVPARTLSADYLAGAFEEIGIQLNVNIVDSTTVLFATWPDVAADTKCNTSHGNYDTAEFAYVLTFDLFGNYFFSYHSEQIPTEENEGNGFNTLRFDNEEMDAALETLQDAIRPEDTLEAAYTVQEVFVSDLAEVVLYYRASSRGVSTRLQNFFKNPSTSSDMWNIEDWWVQE
jgi:peptide/nickel transport system substrate-binding protein